MGVDPKVIRSFVSDAARLAQKAETQLAELGRQRSSGGALNPVLVQGFYDIVHTIKGTATMIPAASETVKALEEIEARLTVQSTLQSARKPDWLELAARSLASARASLAVLERQMSRDSSAVRAASAPRVTDRGILALAEGGGLAWFRASDVARVLGPRELGGKKAFCFEGAWIPVLGQGAYGVILSLPKGKWVVRVESIEGICAESEASSRGARKDTQAWVGSLVASSLSKPKAA